MLTEEQVNKIAEGYYGEGWRAELCADHRELTAQVAALTVERDAARLVLRDVIRMWGDKVSPLTEGAALILRAKAAIGWKE
jgi:hypothetical protein